MQFQIEEGLMLALRITEGLEERDRANAASVKEAQERAQKALEERRERLR